MRSAVLGIGVLAVCALLRAAALDAPASAAPAPRLFTAVYTLEWHGLTAGHSTLSLTEPLPGQYVYMSVSRARGLVRFVFPEPISERSTFRIENGRVVPLEYQEDDGASRRNQNVALKFDWKAKQVRGIAGTKSVAQPLEKGTQDPMSVQIALMRELAAGRSPTHFLLFDKTEAAEYHYTREGNVALDTALGRYDTIVYRSDRPDSDRVMRFWLAPTLGFLPVQAERRRRGKKEFELYIEKLTPQADTVSPPQT